MDALRREGSGEILAHGMAGFASRMGVLLRHWGKNSGYDLRRGHGTECLRRGKVGPTFDSSYRYHDNPGVVTIGYATPSAVP